MCHVGEVKRQQLVQGLVNFRGSEYSKPHIPSVSQKYSTLTSLHESNHRWYIDKWAWPCSNKTLFTNIGSRWDLAHQPQFADSCLRIVPGVCQAFNKYSLTGWMKKGSVCRLDTVPIWWFLFSQTISSVRFFYWQQSRVGALRPLANFWNNCCLGTMSDSKIQIWYIARNSLPEGKERNGTSIY